MKVLLVNGSPNSKGCTYTALSELEKTLNKNGVDTEWIYLGKIPVGGCMSCNYCYTHGRCIIDDRVNEVIDKLDEYDGIVLGSPVYYAGASGQLCSFADRLFYAGGEKMSMKVGAGIVSCRRGGASAAFDRINKYFGISNMIVIGSQYWNQVHGNTPEEVLQDLEGLQTIRTLGENMSFILKCIEAGKKSGIEKPVYEAKLATNFIR